MQNASLNKNYKIASKRQDISLYYEARDHLERIVIILKRKILMMHELILYLMNNIYLYDLDNEEQ